MARWRHAPRREGGDGAALLMSVGLSVRFRIRSSAAATCPSSIVFWGGLMRAATGHGRRRASHGCDWRVRGFRADGRQLDKVSR